MTGRSGPRPVGTVADLPRTPIFPSFHHPARPADLAATVRAPKDPVIAKYCFVGVSQALLCDDDLLFYKALGGLSSCEKPVERIAPGAGNK